MAQDVAFWTTRAAALLARIEAYEDVLLAFATDGAQQEYRFDTGQGELRVVRADLGEIRRLLDALISQHGIVCQRAGLSKGSVQVRPAC